MKRIVRWIGAIGIVMALSACGGGGGGGTPSTPVTPNTPSEGEVVVPEQNNTDSIKGIAQLGYISSGNVKLYELSDLTNPVAITKTSTSVNTEDAGSFIFENLVLDDGKYYLVEISGGRDIDINDDGIINTNDALELNGTVHALVSGDMSKNLFRVNAFSDMAYMKLKGLVATLNHAQIDNELEKIAKGYLYDVNGDNKIDYKDILDFNPTANRDKTKQSYNEILDIYIPKLHSNDSEEKILSALMYLDNPRLLVENGNLQEVPFNLKASIENLPKSVTVKWFIDDREKSSIDETISKDGIYQISARLYRGDELLKTISSTMMATIKTEVASGIATVNENSEIFVTIESNSSLAGTQIIIPNGALKEDTKITIKKSSINSIPTLGGVGISDVLVMEPSGLTFDKPIQIRMPYYEDANLTDTAVRIVRYSEGGAVDYITPLYIDTEHHEIIFETEHFTEFKAEKDLIGKSIDEEFINTLNKELSYGYTIDEWKPILNVYIDKELKQLTIYDYIKTYLENKKLSSIIDNPAGRYGASAINYLYPNANEMGRNFAMWEGVKGGFEMIELLQSSSSAVTKIANGEIYTALINQLGLPTELEDISLYSPIGLGEDIVKSFNDSVNHTLVVELLGSTNCTLENEGAYGEYIEDKLKIQGIKWVAESTCRRYKGYKKNESEQEKIAKEIIEGAISYLKAKGNTLEIDNESIKVETKNPTLGERITLDIEYSINTTLSNFDSKIKVDKETSDHKILSVDAKIEKISNSHYKVSFVPNQSGTFNYYISYNVSNASLGLFDNSRVSKAISIKDKKTNATITGIDFKGNLSADGEKYMGSIEAKFDVNPSLPYEVTIEYKGANTGKLFQINKADFGDNALSNLKVSVRIPDATKDAYIIEDKEFILDIKAKITEALKARMDDTEQAVETTPEPIQATITLYGDVNTKITQGEKYFDQGAIAKDQNGNRLDLDTRSNVDTTKVGSYIVEYRVLDANGNAIATKKRFVEVVEAIKPIAPTLSIPSSKTITHGSNYSVTPTISDDDTSGMKYLWSVSYGGDGASSGVSSSKSGSTLTLTIPTLSPGESGYVDVALTITDNQGNSVKSSIQRYSYSLAKIIQLSFINDNFTDGTLLERNTQKSLTWSVKNSGNVPLNDVALYMKSIADKLQVTDISPVQIATWNVGETKTFSVNLTVPNNITAGTHKQLWNFTYNNGSPLYYSNGTQANIYFEFDTQDPNELVGRLILSQKLIVPNSTINALLEITSGNEPYALQINWGDGTIENQTNLNNNTDKGISLSFDHTYSDEGSYSVTIKTTDDAGKTAIFSDTVTVAQSTTSTSWQVDIHDITTDEKAINTAFSVSSNGEYSTNWQPSLDPSSTEYFVKYRLPVPPNLIALDKMMRVTSFMKASSLTPAYTREMNLRIDNDEYTMAINDTLYGTGYFKIKNLATTEVSEYSVDQLNDGYQDKTFWSYAIGTIADDTAIKLYELDTSYNELYTVTSYLDQSYLNEIDITFKGNGTMGYTYIEYDLNDNGIFESSEKLRLNTLDKNVDWGIFEGSDENTTTEDNTTDTNTSTPPPSSGSSTIKKTGQTLSYNESGTVVTDGSVKDDGFYQKGIVSSYTRDSAKEIVTDNVTGLMWQDNADATSVTKPWVTQANYDAGNYSDTSGDTATTYCSNLTLGGYSDWRLPLYEELESIVDYGRYAPTIDPVFLNVTSSYYWSATSSASYADYAWGVHFYYGDDFWYDKSHSFYVRCVRAGE